ncbi:hypothetical protein [Leifsonia aquatica]|uniref:hypothetical protein n=1 Tax=Leifsonia aquatica TaxID=144185 RepID=UPI0037F75515
MKTLLDDRFAPITWQIGFLRCSLERAVEASKEWLTPEAELEVRRVKGSLEHSFLPALLPLTQWGRYRKLLAPIGDGWVAFMDSNYSGADYSGSVRTLSRIAGCGYAVIGSKPYVDDRATSQRGLGGLQFLWAREPEDVIRYIQLSEDRPRWGMYFGGEPQPFEEPERYTARRLRDRFDSGMLERYCQAIGIDVFNPDAYGPEGVIVDISKRRPDYVDPVQTWLLNSWKHTAELDITEGREPTPLPLPSGKPPRLFTLAESQAYMGVEPGIPSTLPG